MPHAGRLCCDRVGGLATAVMGGIYATRQSDRLRRVVPFVVQSAPDVTDEVIKDRRSSLLFHPLTRPRDLDSG